MVITLAVANCFIGALAIDEAGIVLKVFVLPPCLFFIVLLNVTFWTHLTGQNAPARSRRGFPANQVAPVNASEKPGDGFAGLWSATMPTSSSARVATTSLIIIVLVETYAIAFLILGIKTTLATDAPAIERALAAFYYSVVTFTTLGYGDILPASMPAQILAIVEVLNGLVVFGLFVAYMSTIVGELRDKHRE